MTLSRTLVGLCAAVLCGATLAQPATDATAPLWAAEHAREDAGDLAGAIRACMDILRQHPKDAQAMNVIAGLNGKQGRYRDEVAWAQRALSADPGFFRAEINRGTALAQLGQPRQAQAAFEHARQLAPNDPMPVYSLGVLAENRRDARAATALYEQSVKLDAKPRRGLVQPGRDVRDDRPLRRCAGRARQGARAGSARRGRAGDAPPRRGRQGGQALNQGAGESAASVVALRDAAPEVISKVSAKPNHIDRK